MGEVPWKGGEGFLPSQSLRDGSPYAGAKALIRHGFAVTPPLHKGGFGAPPSVLGNLMWTAAPVIMAASIYVHRKTDTEPVPNGLLITHQPCTHWLSALRT